MQRPKRQTCETLAAAYVLGSLRGGARRRVERRRRNDAQLEQSIVAWERYATQAVMGMTPIAPPARLWRHIAQRLAATSPVDLRQRVNVWRRTALAAAVFAVGLATALVLNLQRVAPDSYGLALLYNEMAQPVWLVSQIDERELTVRALDQPSPSTGLELWLIGSDGRPHSIGLLDPSRETRLALRREFRTLLSANASLAVSEEPRTGSPTGAPTGPVRYRGSWLPPS